MVKKQIKLSTVEQKKNATTQKSAGASRKSKGITGAKKRSTPKKASVQNQPVETILTSGFDNDDVIVADEQLLEHAEFNNYITETQARIIRRVEQKKRIDSWLDKGLISDSQQGDLYALIGMPNVQAAQAEQPSRIERYYAEEQNSQTEMSSYFEQSAEPIDMGLWIRRVSLFAVGCIMLGLIAMIAANWQNISDTVKLLGYFGCFVGLLTSLFAVDSMQHKWGKECLLWSNIGWIFAGIGLLGQVYHLSGTFWNALLYGSVLSTPFILSSSLSASLILWAGAYCVGAVFGVSDTQAPIYVMAILPVVLWKKDNAVVSIFWWIAIVVSLMKQEWLGELLENMFNQMMPVTFAGIILLFLVVLVGICRRFVGVKTAFTQIVQVFAGLFAVCAAAMIDITYTSGSVRHLDMSVDSLRTVWSLVYLFGGAFAVLTLSVCCLPKTIWPLVVKFLGGFVLVAFIYNFLTAPIFGFIFTLIWLLGVSIIAIRTRYVGLFNFCLFLMVVRILVAYITVLLSLESIGFALVSFGFVLLGIIWAYAKGYPLLRRLIAQMEEAND